MRALAVVAVLALAPRAAHADPEAEEIAKRGFAAYDRGEYAAAIAYFERAYEVDPNPGLLFNIAQAYRQFGAPGCERALAYYRRYRAALVDSGAPIDEGLRARIIEMQACVESDAVPDAGGEPASDAPGGQVEPGGVQVEPGADAVSAAGSSRRRAGWIALGVASAAVATAAVTGALALDRESALSARCPEGVCPPSLEGSVRGYDQLRYAAFASGAAGVVALAVGGYLLLGSNRPDPALGAGIQPVLGHGTVGVRCAF